MRKSGIDYVDASWGPWRGCTPVSEGCRNCYAKREMTRFGRDFNTITRASVSTFYAPLRIEKPTRFFVCPWGDFFHKDVPDRWMFEALKVIVRCPQHTFVIVTKRPALIRRIYTMLYNFPLNVLCREGIKPNVWFVASVENQATADERIPHLLALREYGEWPVLGVSYEPALGPVDFDKWLPEIRDHNKWGYLYGDLDWIVMGGESGPNARPMHPDWVRSTRDACKASGVPFWFKQWGEWGPSHPANDPLCVVRDTSKGYPFIPESYNMMARLGKKAAGNLIDGETWKQLPEGRVAEE